jgi:patatin-related protein
MPAPITAEPDPTQEIRFAVVLYGGVSLAVYINGVAQELFRMVRATADLPAGEPLDAVEAIYRELGQILFHGREPLSPGEAWPPPQADAPVRTRFVVDIVSGSSAGGINGIALAKALALKSRSLAGVRKTWIDEADLHVLLNDRGSDLGRYPSGPTATSLLNSERMYSKLYDTFWAMNDEGLRTTGAGAFADNIDLFVTATDLNGLNMPIQLTDQKIDERVHRTVFHFEYADPVAADDYGLSDAANDFDADFDAMLAFAARCTSSFPVAFEPMRFRTIERLVRERRHWSLDDACRRYARFFPNYVGQQDSFSDRPFADGGYLDNRPFSHAIDLIQYRSSRRPVQRKLLFVDPFPEFAGDRPFREEISFTENAMLAAMRLPRYETIRGDIEAVNASNRRQDQLESLRRRVAADMGRLNARAGSHRPGAAFVDRDLAAMTRLYGECYATYHHLRVYDVSDLLARIVTRVAGYTADVEACRFIRLVMRSWRNALFDAYDTPGKATENAFLYRFDIDYRQRRLNHLRVTIDELLKGGDAETAVLRRLAARGAASTDPAADRAAPSVPRADLQAVRTVAERQLARLKRLRRTLASPLDSPLRDRILAFNSVLAPADFAEVMTKVTGGAQHRAANVVFERHRPVITLIMDGLGEHLEPAFRQHRQEMLAALSAPALAPLLDEYESFEYHDMLSQAYLAETDTKEYAKVEVFRVSPADSQLLPFRVERGDRKLTGTAFGAFGAFMDRAWRENDMMWGRLDGAERIIHALLPDPGDRRLCEHYVERVRHQIRTDEIGAGDGRRIFEWLAERLRERVAPDASAGDLVHEGRSLLQTFPMLQSIVQSEKFETFVREYYRLPTGPTPTRMMQWLGRGLKIFGRMIDGLEVAKGGSLAAVSRALKTTGSGLTTLIGFAIPQSFGQRLGQHWLMLTAAAGVVLAVAGAILQQADITAIGIGAIAACLAMSGLLHGVGRLLSRTWRLNTVVRALLAVLVVLLVLVALVIFAVGAHTSWQWLNTAVDACTAAWPRIGDCLPALTSGRTPDGG